MNQNTRIVGSDDVTSVIAKMSDGNPGALNVMCLMMREALGIDPEAVMGGLIHIMTLDSHGIYGSDIYLLYNDICKQDMTNMIGVLRAVQLGFVNESELVSAIKACGEPPADIPLPPLDIEALVEQVRKRLPSFGHDPIVLG